MIYNDKKISDGIYLSLSEDGFATIQVNSLSKVSINKILKDSKLDDKLVLQEDGSYQGKINIPNEILLELLSKNISKYKNKNIKNIDKLTDKFLGTNVDFDGNMEFSPFYGTVEGFSVDTDGSIYTTLKDMENDYFDINISEIPKFENFIKNKKSKKSKKSKKNTM